ncbi:MAG: SOS response-associated peptidase [Candidatus Thorarchaeota archaeon]|nr:MAG: SOS response-associated peptidase [Candidatus Thorarchaeota archaeon]
MCGRFYLLSHQEAIRERFGIEEFDFEITPRYNIAPQQKIAVAVSDPKVRLVGMHWGLVPFWAKDMKIGNRMINARAETLVEKRAFKPAFKKRRCIILSSGFYEWQRTAKGKKPMNIRLQSGDPFALAGIYERWKAPSEKIILSTAIITTRPNKTLSSIHNRMPVILRRDDERAWMDVDLDDLDRLQQMLQPYSDDEMEAFEVSTYVNNPKNEGPMCIRPIDSEQASLL